MNSYIYHIKNSLVVVIFALLSSCSNDFLTQNLTSVLQPIGVSNIYISPEWQGANRAFRLPISKNVEFQIMEKPSWLNVVSETGTLNDSIGVINCSASRNADFSAVGIYMDFMTVKADNKSYKVPVGYITEGKPALQVNSSITLYPEANQNNALSVVNNGLGILVWDIVSMPNWLEIDNSRLESNAFIITQNSSASLPLKLKLSPGITGVLQGTLVISTNDKSNSQVSINVTAQLGTPRLSIYSSTVDFSSADVSKTLSFSNQGSGVLTWEFQNLPAWLTVSPLSGLCSSYTTSGTITFTCDRTKLSPGQNSVVVKLKTNDIQNPLYSITVSAVTPGNSDNIRAIEGNVVDVLLNKNTNTLYYVTSAPNKFIAFDLTSKSISYQIDLTKAPTCFAISEDWTRAAIGHNGNLTAIDISSKSVTSTYTLDCSVNDIAWGENSWFCFTQIGGSFTCLHWINTLDGSRIDDSKNTNLDGGSQIKKVPNQPFLIGTRGGTSPSGFFAYSVATKSQKSYGHMSLTNFWMSEDGQYVFDQGSNVYRTTSATGSTDNFNNTINTIGKIVTGSAYSYPLNFVSHINKNLWVIQNESYSSSASANIYQIEDNDYTLVKMVDYSKLYQPNVQTSAFNVKAIYVYPNNTETEVVILCKGTTNNVWNMQFVPIK